MTPDATRGADYAQRLVALQTARWKRWLAVQAPFGWNLRRLAPGFTLDLGCGIGRNLLHLRGLGVGIDTNPHCVRVARTRGLVAFTPEEFAGSVYNRPGRFDSLLLAHVAEHLAEDDTIGLIRRCRPLVRPHGQLILMCPQEAGFASDPSHVEFMDFQRLAGIASRTGFPPERSFSFPFPRWAGRFFTYNEFVLVGRTPASAARQAGPTE
jgi:SAM-dependent methyltransferase